MITRDDLGEKLSGLTLQERSDVLCYLFGYCRATNNAGFFEGLESALRKLRLGNSGQKRGVELRDEYNKQA